ncbi:MAG: efflux RND transporter periplasmic adaptor subunit [Gammaproteobacteria bacterium]
MLNMIGNLLKLLLLLSLLTACDQSTQNKQDRRATRAKLVTALPVEKLALGTQQQVSGSLTALQQVKIFNQESGQIKKLPYFQGDFVKKGTILVFIKNDKIRAALTKSKATRLEAEIVLNRLDGLSKKNLTSQDEISQAKTALALAKAEESIIQIRLNDTSIKAPFTGVISERFFEPGDIVPLHSYILSIIDNTRLIVKIQVSELLLPELVLNSKVTIKIDALKNLKNVTGTISRIYPTIDPVTRKGTLEVELDFIPEGAKPGQLSRVIIYTPAIERLLIDVSAIQYNNSGEYVYRVNKDKHAIKVKVKTGVQINTKIEITEGLKENDLIIVEGFSRLKDGIKVKIANSVSKKLNLKSVENIQ